MEKIKDMVEGMAVIDLISHTEPAIVGEAGLMRAGYRDDNCDCLFVNVWEWKNPYLGTTMRFRFCCWLRAQRAQFPQFFEDVMGYHVEATDEVIKGLREWDVVGEPMPRHLWYRQVAYKTGRPLAEIRLELKDKEPPIGRLLVEVQELGN